ncbi:MAG: TetR/AcrR family transcriptional regulator [Acidimicrobiales bacterium]
MAKAGTASRVGGRTSGRSAGTRQRLIEAAIETLKVHGPAGASARVIAERAHANQGLVSHHFGSVVNLLLAALDHVSALRMGHSRARLGEVPGPTDLVAVATAIFREELDAGHVDVLTEMIAGASSTPGSDQRWPHASTLVLVRPGRHRTGARRLNARYRRALRGHCLGTPCPLSRARDADPSRRRPDPRDRPVLPCRTLGPASRSAPAASSRTGHAMIAGRRP